MVNKPTCEELEQRIRESEKKFRLLADNSVDMISLHAADGTMLYVSPSCESLSGYTVAELLGKPADFLVFPDDIENVRSAIHMLQGSEDRYVVEHRLSRKDGSVIWVESTGRAVRDASGKVMEIQSCVRDITDRRQAENLVQNQLAEIASYYDNIPVGLAVFDADLRFIRINRLLAEINGIPAADHIGKSVKEIVPTLEETARNVASNIIGTGQPVRNIEFTGETDAQPGVARSWLESWYPLMGADQEIFGFTVIVEEITERKRAVEEIEKINDQLRRLSAHLQDTIEKERLSIAREIHDDLGQSLSALKMDINWIKKRLHSDQTPVAEKLDVMASEINRSIQSVKRICTELRPAILDDLGLAYIVEWHTSQFQERTGIRCCLNMKMTDVTIDSPITTALYRIHQEALTNVARHAQATEVDVSLAYKENRILLEIKDNGRGIRDSDLSGSTSYGIIGMRERVYALGGDFDISGKPGRGTRISVSVPVKR